MRTQVVIAIILGLCIGSSYAGPPRTAVVERTSANGSYASEGVVEAVRQTTLAAQVPGKITALYVKAGDRFRTGQVLARIDSRAANQESAASEARVKLAQAQLIAAQNEFDRAQMLAQKHYISQAALDRAQAQFQVTKASVDAQLAEATAASIGASLHTLTAPYAGRVSSVEVSLGDMALPGKPLLTLFDPSALRVSANVPQTVIASLRKNGIAKIEIPALPEAARWIKPRAVTILPVADDISHTVQIRLDLPVMPAEVIPGMFARAWLPTDAAGKTRLSVPLGAVIHRTELDAVYVVDSASKVSLRQVRIGAVQQDHVEILTGLSEGEHVALDPLAAAASR